MMPIMIFDPDVQDIINYIGYKKRFTELELRKRLRKDLELIRKVIYLLQKYGITYPITSLMNRNRYDYKWGVKKTTKEIYEILLKDFLKQIEEKKKELPEYAFVCKDCNIILSFEEAEKFDMRCPECGEILEMVPNPRIQELERLEQRIYTFLNNLDNYVKEANQKVEMIIKASKK